MVQADLCIKNYIKSYCSNDEQLLDILNNCRLRRIMMDSVKKINDLEYIKTRLEIGIQKITNEIIEKEIKTISKIFQENQIKVVLLKGLLLADELYSPREMRHFSDIDILINMNDLEASLDILGSLGYRNTENNEIVNRNMVDGKLHEYLYTRSHIPDMKRNVNYNGKTIWLKIDLHVRLSHNIKNDIEHVHNVIERSVVRNVWGTQVRHLDVYDNLLYLLYHFVKEYFTIGLEYVFSLGKRQYPRISALHDIILFIDKHCKSIDWKLFTVRAAEWGMSGEILLGLHIADRIYPDRIPECVFLQLFDNYSNSEIPLNSGYLKRNINELLSINPDDFIFKDIREIIVDTVSRSIQGPTVKCPLKQVDHCDKMPGEIIIDECRQTISNIFHSHLKSGNKPESSADCSARLKIWWDYDNLYTEIQVNDGKLHPIKDFQGEMGSIGFSIGPGEFPGEAGSSAPDAGKGYIRLLSFNPQIIDNGKKLTVWDYFHKETEVECVFPYSLDVKDYGYNLSITLPWSYIGIKPEVGKKIWFDAEVRYKSMSSHKTRTELAWANLNHAWYDPTLLGILELVK